MQETIKLHLFFIYFFFGKGGLNEENDVKENNLNSLF